jgi:hypothetical protein
MIFNVCRSRNLCGWLCGNSTLGNFVGCWSNSMQSIPPRHKFIQFSMFVYGKCSLLYSQLLPKFNCILNNKNRQYMSPDWQNHLELISCITEVVLTMACCHGGGFMWLPIITIIGDKLEILTDLKK